MKTDEMAKPQIAEGTIIIDARKRKIKPRLGSEKKKGYTLIG